MKEITVTITFKTREDCAWFYGIAARQMAKPGELGARDTSIMLDALGRAANINSTMSPDEAKAQRMGRAS